LQYWPKTVSYPTARQDVDGDQNQALVTGSDSIRKYVNYLIDKVLQFLGFEVVTLVILKLRSTVL
jgi:hypothetical protein